MRIAIDTETRLPLTWAGATLAAVQATRHDRFPVELRFLSAGAYVELPPTAAGRLALKRPGDYAGDTLAAALTWAKSGNGPRAIYTFDLTLDTLEIAAAFEAEPASVSLVLEIQWTIGNHRLTSSPLPLTLANDYIRETDGLPVPAIDLRATEAEARSGTNNTTYMTPLRVAQAIDSRGLALTLALGG